MNIIEKLKEKIKNIFNRKNVTRLLIGGTALGIASTGIACEKKQNEDTNPKQVEAENSAEKFRESIVYDTDQQSAADIHAQKVANIKAEIDSLQTPDQVLQYLKDTYIETYQNMLKKGELDVSTIPCYDEILNQEDGSNLTIVKSSPDYIFNTGNGFVTHDANPQMTQNTLTNLGIEHTPEYNISIYTVSLNGSIIDCATIQNGEWIKVTPGNQYEELQNYTSILADSVIGNFISSGYNYKNSLENLSKDNTEYNRAILNASKDKFLDNTVTLSYRDEEHSLSNSYYSLIEQPYTYTVEVDENLFDNDGR